MAERNAATKGTRRSAKSTGGEASGTFMDEEKAAARERVKELKRSPPAGKADGERDVLEKISEMDDADCVMAERIHAIVTASAPDLVPRTWYGMPAYDKDGTIVPAPCSFQAPASPPTPRFMISVGGFDRIGEGARPFTGRRSGPWARPAR
jgi:hypothetical protein